MAVSRCCIRNAGPLFSIPVDTPAIAVGDKSHLGSLSPPAIYLPWGWGPNILHVLYICQISEQRFVGLTWTRTRDVIGMYDEADQAVLLHDFIDLPLP